MQRQLTALFLCQELQGQLAEAACPAAGAHHDRRPRLQPKADPKASDARLPVAPARSSAPVSLPSYAHAQGAHARAPAARAAISPNTIPHGPPVAREAFPPAHARGLLKARELPHVRERPRAEVPRPLPEAPRPQPEPARVANGGKLAWPKQETPRQAEAPTAQHAKAAHGHRAAVNPKHTLPVPVPAAAVAAVGKRAAGKPGAGAEAGRMRVAVAVNATAGAMDRQEDFEAWQGPYRRAALAVRSALAESMPDPYLRCARAACAPTRHNLAEQTSALLQTWCDSSALGTCAQQHKRNRVCILLA